MKWFLPCCLLAVILISSFGCKPADPQLDALQQLTRQGYTLSVTEYHRAAANGDTHALDLFLQAGTAVDVPMVEEGVPITALRRTIQKGHSKTAIYLLAQTASIHAAQTANLPPLLTLAVEANSPALTRTLLQHPDLPPPDLQPLLNHAAARAFNDVLEILMDHAPGLNLQPALLQAASHGHLSTLGILIRLGADPNQAEPESGLTALMIAARNHHRNSLDLLLNSGTYRFACDHQGLLAWDHALAQNHPALASYLQQPPKAHEREIGVLQDNQTQANPAWAEAILEPAKPTAPGSPSEERSRQVWPLHLQAVGHYASFVEPRPPAERLQLQQVRPSQLPFHLVAVQDGIAQLEDLTRPGQSYQLKIGDRLAASPWIIEQIHPAAHPSVPPWAGGSVHLRHETDTTRCYRLFPGIAARSGRLCAVIHLPGTDEYYEGHVGDQFRFVSEPGLWQIRDIRPDRMLLTARDQSLIVQRDPAHR
jgi:ankyrin repeat protein